MKIFSRKKHKQFSDSPLEALRIERTTLIDYLIYDIELVFVELPKFNKELEELETLTDK